MYAASFKGVSSSLSLRFVRKTSNLLTGATEVDQTTVVELGKEMPTEIHSHLHPNLTIQIVDDHTPWVKGQVPAPLDEFIEFDKYVRHEEYYGLRCMIVNRVKWGKMGHFFEYFLNIS